MVRRRSLRARRSLAFLLIGRADAFFFRAGAFRGAAGFFAASAARSSRVCFICKMACVSCAPREVCLGASGSAFFCLLLREAAPLVSETIQSGVSSSVPTMMRTGSSETGAAWGLRLRRGVWRSSAMGFTSLFNRKAGRTPPVYTTSSFIILHFAARRKVFLRARHANPPERIA